MNKTKFAFHHSSFIVHPFLKRFFLFFIFCTTSFASQAVVEYTPSSIPIDTIVLPNTDVRSLSNDAIGPSRHTFKIGDSGMAGLMVAMLLLGFLLLRFEISDGLDETFLLYLLPSLSLLIGRIFIRLFAENKEKSFFQKENMARISFRPLAVAMIAIFMLAFFTLGEADTLFGGFALSISLTAIPLLGVWIGNFLHSPNRFTIIQRNGKYGFNNKVGRVVIPAKYDAVRPFKKGLAAVQYKGKWGFINAAGETEIRRNTSI
jgi:hypothetical protein